MMRIFKTRHFHRWVRKTELTDAALCKAVEELEGLQTIAADLLARTGKQLDEAVADGTLQEICQ